MTARGLAALAVLAAALAASLAGGREEAHPRRADMIAAAQYMAKAEALIAEERVALGYPIDLKTDPNRTGLIGLEVSDITTSVGDIAAKRTSANPDFAALTVRWFDELGLKAGDKIAVGASGSFPGIIVAVLSACAATGVEPLLIPSLGASEYGANIPGLTSVEMIDLLRRKGLFTYAPAAVSLGGEGDAGKSGFLFADSRSILSDIALASGYPLIQEPDVARSIARRLKIFREQGPVRAFVNIGGAEANYGTSPASLLFPNGLVRDISVRAFGPERGLVFEFAEQGIPVIHFLYIAGLAMKNGLPIDPVPLPLPGEGAVYSVRKPAELPALIGLAAAAGLLFFSYRPGLSPRRRRGA